MAITISSLKEAIGVGARSNLFEVSITFPTQTNGSEKFSSEDGGPLTSNLVYLCKGAQLPGSTVGLIEVPFAGGRRYKLAGDRTFADWTTTIINDANQTIRQAVEKLQQLYGHINFDGDTYKDNFGAAGEEFNTVTVTQFDLAGNAVYKYTLVNCWPSDISTIDLSYDSTDVLEEFTVTWSYDYFTFEQLS